MSGADAGVDVAALAAPISTDAPAGVDLRQDFSAHSVYYRLRDARAEAREKERLGDSSEDESDKAVPPQWRTARDLALSALAERSKDLEIASWLTEALVRLSGMAGLAAGARLITALADAFWDHSLYPLPDEDGIATRTAPVAGLNGSGGDGTLMQPLRKQVLFAKPDGTPVTYWQYAQSQELETITDPARRKQRLAARVVPLADLAQAARVQGGAHFTALRAEAKAALTAWTRMGERLDALAGADAPPTSRVGNLLQAILDIAGEYAPPEIEEAAAVEGGDELAVTEAQSVALPQQTRPATREDMLRELGKIADYFRRTEPHSPLAYTLEEAVRRGRLTWPELLEEVVPDGGARNAILVMLGIRPPPPPNK